MFLFIFAISLLTWISQFKFWSSHNPRNFTDSTGRRVTLSISRVGLTLIGLAPKNIYSVFSRFRVSLFALNQSEIVFRSCSIHHFR